MQSTIDVDQASRLLCLNVTVFKKQLTECDPGSLLSSFCILVFTTFSAVKCSIPNSRDLEKTIPGIREYNFPGNSRGSGFGNSRDSGSNLIVCIGKTTPLRYRRFHTDSNGKKMFQAFII